MVDAFRVGQGCVLASQPLNGSRDHPWWKAGGAPAGALCAVVHTITGLANRSLRAQVVTLLGAPSSMSQMSDDMLDSASMA